MLQHFGIVGQIGVDDEAQTRQVDAARGDVGRHADARAAVAQGLQGLIALALAQLARQRDGREAALGQGGVKMAHRFAGVAEHQRARRIVKAQQVDDGMFGVARANAHGAIFDVGMGLAAVGGGNAQRVALIALGQRHDGLGQGRREQQRAAFGRRGLEDEFEILAEAHVEHLVGLVEHQALEAGDIERAAFEMIAQAARRADDDMGAALKRAALGLRIHAADAGDDLGAGELVEPGQLALDLQRQFAGRRHDQRQRRAGRAHPLFVAEQGFAKRQAKGDGLAGAGLGRDQKVAADGFGRQHSRLHGGGFGIVLLRQRAGERRGRRRKCHEGNGPCR